MSIQKTTIGVITTLLFAATVTLAHAETATTPAYMNANRPVKPLIGTTSAGLPTKLDKLTNLKDKLPQDIQKKMENLTPGKRLLGAAQLLSNTADRLSTLSAKLQLRITTLKNNGKDTTTLDSLLSDMQAKIKDAKVQAAAITTAITPLASTETTEVGQNRAIYKDAYQKLLLGIRDLKAAGQDARQIIQLIISMGGLEKTASNSAAVRNVQAPPLMSR